MENPIRQQQRLAVQQHLAWGQYKALSVALTNSGGGAANMNCYIRPVPSGISFSTGFAAMSYGHDTDKLWRLQSIMAIHNGAAPLTVNIYCTDGASAYRYLTFSMTNAVSYNIFKEIGRTLPIFVGDRSVFQLQLLLLDASKTLTVDVVYQEIADVINLRNV